MLLNGLFSLFSTDIVNSKLLKRSIQFCNWILFLGVCGLFLEELLNTSPKIRSDMASIVVSYSLIGLSVICLMAGVPLLTKVKMACKMLTPLLFMTSLIPLYHPINTPTALSPTDVFTSLLFWWAVVEIIYLTDCLLIKGKI